ncbi:pre-rRNA processing protein Utp22 [Gloeopeniophorella convolvens]|nr:pre-rRNA processing protein Utp22 [Gloeopeniophorella convolvens]
MPSTLKRRRAHEVEGWVPKKRQVSLEYDDGPEPSGRDEFDSDEAAVSHAGSPSSEDGEDPPETSYGAEEWGGIGANGDERTVPGQPSTGKVHKPPTGDEVRAIKEAQELFMSSSFKLQIDALLPNIRPKESRKAPLDRFLFALHAYLSALPPVSPQHPLEAARALLAGTLPSDAKGKEKAHRQKDKAPSSQSIAVPFPLPVPTEDANWKVAFQKPVNIAVVGGWINNVVVKSKDEEPWVVDVAVEMPSELFQEKDYMNGRFFHKRAFYIAVLAKYVSDPANKLNVETFYESKKGDPRLTTLILRPKNDDTPTDFSKLNAVVRIIPVLSPSSPIQKARLAPHRSNFRVNSSDSSGSSQENLPTPLYNSAILLASSPQRDVIAVNTLKNEIPAYRDALSLLRVWANQRGYGEGQRLCVRGFEGSGPWWNTVLEALILGEEPHSKIKTKRRPLGKGLSSYQLFKATLDFLSRHDFTQESVFVKSKNGHLFPPEEYSELHEAILVDSSSCVNVLAGVPPTSVEMLKHDARATLEILDGSISTGDPFTEVFLADHREPASRFDIMMIVELSSASLRRPSVHDILDRGSLSNSTLASLPSLLRKALGSRIEALAILHPTSRPRPIAEGLPAGPEKIFIGLILDQEHAFRLVDHGPAAAETQSSAADEFRELWGDKAELRRFQDGSITESVVWNVQGSDERTQIPAMVVRHILARHFGIHGDAVISWQPAFDSLLRLPPSISSHYRAAGFKAALAAFQGLASSIKGFDKELPLAVLNISPVAPELRYTSVFAPVSIPITTARTLPSCARHVPLISLNLEFEKSARWPDDLAAIQKMKMAFLERLAQALTDATPGLHARIAVELPAGVPPIADHVQLEVATPDGWAFALRIWHDREATLLDRILHAPPAANPTSPHEVENARIAHRLYIKRFIAAPRHHRAVAALCHRFVAFGGTVRLVKRWLAAHWLLRLHVSEEAVEVLCGAVFAGAGPASVPTTRERGFARVIRLLRGWQWADGMTVPLYSDSDPAPDVGSSAASGAKGVWVLKTEADPDGRMWTVDGPDHVAAHRIRALAQATHDCLQGMETGVLDVSSIFAHPEDDYDFVVKLQPTVLPRYFQNVAADQAVWMRSGKYANAPPPEKDVPYRPGFDPAEMFLDDLTRIYADTAKFFHDPLGGDRFGAIWDPSVTQPRPFRVMNRFSSTPVAKGKEKGKDKDLVVLNEAGVLSEIVRMGEGLVMA